MTFQPRPEPWGRGGLVLAGKQKPRGILVHLPHFQPGLQMAGGGPHAGRQ